MISVCMRCNIPLIHDEYCPHCSFGEACDCDGDITDFLACEECGCIVAVRGETIDPCYCDWQEENQWL